MSTEAPRPYRGPDVETWVETKEVANKKKGFLQPRTIRQDTAHIEVNWRPDREVAWLIEFIQTRKRLEKEFAESASAALNTPGDFRPALAIIEARKVLDIPNITTDYLFNAGVVERAVGLEHEADDPIGSMLKADHMAFDIDPEVESKVEDIIKTAREQIKGTEESDWFHEAGDRMAENDFWGAGLALHEEAKACLKKGSAEMAMRSLVHSDTYLRKKAVEVSGEDSMEAEIIGMEVRDQRAIVLYELADIYKSKKDLTEQEAKDLIYLVVNLEEVGAPRDSSKYGQLHLRLMRTLSEKIRDNSKSLSLQHLRARRLVRALDYYIEVEEILESGRIVRLDGDYPETLTYIRLKKLAQHLE